MYTSLLICAQILLEPLPISSSGHVKLLELFFTRLKGAPVMLSEYSTYLAHGPTIIIELLFFMKIWLTLCRAYGIRALLTFGILADGSTVLIYYIKKYGIVGDIPLWVGFLISAGMLISTRWARSHSVQNICWHYALLIGIAQGIALFAGISRFASTYSVACWCGIAPLRAFALSWALQLPLIIAAFSKALWAGSSILLDIYTVGLISISTLGSYYLLYVVSWLISSNRVWIFGIYILVLVIGSILGHIYI